MEGQKQIDLCLIRMLCLFSLTTTSSVRNCYMYIYYHSTIKNVQK